MKYLCFFITVEKPDVDDLMKFKEPDDTNDPIFKEIPIRTLPPQKSTTRPPKTTTKFYEDFPTGLDSWSNYYFNILLSAKLLY